MESNNYIGFETDLPIQKVAELINQKISGLDANVKQVNIGNDKVNLSIWHFNHNQSLIDCNLQYTPNFAIKWLLTINTEIPIEFNTYGNYKIDEKNVEDLTAIFCNTFKESSDFNNVKKYSHEELKKLGIG